MRPRSWLGLFLLSLPLLCVALGLGLRIVAPVQAQEFDAGVQQIRHEGPGGAAADPAIDKASSPICNAGPIGAIIFAAPPSDIALVGYGAFLAVAPPHEDDSPPFWIGRRADFDYFVVPTGGSPAGPYIIPPTVTGYAGGGFLRCVDVGTITVDVYVDNGFLADFCTTSIVVFDPGVCP